MCGVEVEGEECTLEWANHSPYPPWALAAARARRYTLQYCYVLGPAYSCTLTAVVYSCMRVRVTELTGLFTAL